MANTTGTAQIAARAARNATADAEDAEAAAWKRADDTWAAVRACKTEAEGIAALRISRAADEAAEAATAALRAVETADDDDDVRPTAAPLPMQVATILVRDDARASGAWEAAPFYSDSGAPIADPAEYHVPMIGRVEGRPYAPRVPRVFIARANDCFDPPAVCILADTWEEAYGAATECPSILRALYGDPLTSAEAADYDPDSGAISHTSEGEWDTEGMTVVEAAEWDLAPPPMFLPAARDASREERATTLASHVRTSYDPAAARIVARMYGAALRSAARAAEDARRAARRASAEYRAWVAMIGRRPDAGGEIRAAEGCADDAARILGRAVESLRNAAEDAHGIIVRARRAQTTN